MKEGKCAHTGQVLYLHSLLDQKSPGSQTNFPFCPILKFDSLNATDAAYLHDWHNFHKRNLLLPWEFRKGYPSASVEQGHLKGNWAGKGYAKWCLGALSFNLTLSHDFFDLFALQEADFTPYCLYPPALPLILRIRL